MEQTIDWKEQKFQEKLSQIFEIIGTDFYSVLSNISEQNNIPKLQIEKGEKIITIKREYPTLFGEKGSRPDIYIETNKGNVIAFELKPSDFYDDDQLIRHDENLKKWITDEENQGKTYLGTILILNKDSERDKIKFESETIFWLGWDNVYKSLSDLKINTIDSKLRNEIDKILSETPVNKLNEILKNQLLRESDESNLFQLIKNTVLIIELMDQLKTQMGLEKLLEKYEPINGNENHKEFTEKTEVLYTTILKGIRSEFEKEEFVVKIETTDYSDYFTIHLIKWRGNIIVDFRPLLNEAKDYILVREYLQSGPKYSLLKPLIKFFNKDRDIFEEVESVFKSIGVDWYCKFGSSDPIKISKDTIDVIKEREFLPIYCDKKINILNKEQDEILGEVIETIPKLVDLYTKLLETEKTNA